MSADKIPTPWYASRPRVKKFRSRQVFSPEFWAEVEGFEKKFHLRRDKFGHSVATNDPASWQPYLLRSQSVGLAEKLVFVKAKHLSWNHIGQAYQNSSILSTVDLARFLVTLTIARLPEGSNMVRSLTADEVKSLQLIRTETVAIHFARDHPQSPPTFFIEQPEGGVSSAHAHHWYSNGNLCISAHSAWRANPSTTQYLGLAVAWIVWHNRKFSKRSASNV